MFFKNKSELKAFVVALSPGFAQADDVLQEVFLTVTTKAHEFDPRRSPPDLPRFQGPPDRALRPPFRPP